MPYTYKYLVHQPFSIFQYHNSVDCVQVNMFRFARLCMESQQGQCKRGKACKYLHICRDLLVSNRCSNGANCERGHDFEGTILRRCPSRRSGDSTRSCASFVSVIPASVRDRIHEAESALFEDKSFYRIKWKLSKFGSHYLLGVSISTLRQWCWKKIMGACSSCAVSQYIFLS